MAAVSSAAPYLGPSSSQSNLSENARRERRQRSLSPTKYSAASVDRTVALQARSQSNNVYANGDTSASRRGSPDHLPEGDNPAKLKVSKNSIGRDLGLLPPNRVKLAVRDGSDVSGAGSEADSLLELYGNTTTQRNGTNGGRRGDDSRINGDLYLLDDEDPESSRWIHRDKLARIEIEEMQRAGIYLGPDMQRPLNKPAPELRNEAGNHVRDRPADADARALDQKRPSAEPSKAQGAAEEPMSFELRRPEEAAAESREEREARTSQTRRLMRKSSWSKIPVLKSSPAPVPKDYIERHTPAPRNRTGVWGSVDEDNITYRKARSRSRSVGSQVLLDDATEGGGGGSGGSSSGGGGGGGGGGGSGSGGRRSPGPRVSSLEASAKSKNAGRPPTSSHGLRTSGSRNVSGPNRLRTQPAQGSKESPGQRPSTRSGETPPKTAVKRPEGDPPWLATMYKPDPRLPPEQQLIPTVAKRLQQEQWEREGKPASLRGPDFGADSGLGAEETDAPPSSPSPAPQQQLQPQPQPPSPAVTPAPAPASAPEPAAGGAQKRADEVEWPLKSPTTTTVPATTASGADSSKPGHDPAAEYTATPGIQQQTPRDTAKPNVAAPALPVEPLRIQPASDEKEAKAGCKCCIVM